MSAYSVAQLCLTLCDPMDCSPPGSSVQGILQARIRLPFPSPWDLPDPEHKPTFPVSPALTSRFFTTKPPRKPNTAIYTYIYIYIFIQIDKYN